MNNKEFITELARRTGFQADEAQKIISNVLNAMGDAFQEGNTVQITNFGTFEVKKKLERIMVNPITGQRMLVPPKLVLAFKPNSVWKDRIKNGGE